MKGFYILCASLFINSLSFGQVSYNTGWDNTTEQSGWQQIRKGDNSLYEWTMETGNPLSAPNNIAHYYPVGGSVPTDDWYVSPGFDFTTGGSIDSIWSSFAGFGTPMAGDTIAIYLLNGSSDPDLATKTMLYSYTDSVYQNDNTWRKDSNIVVPPTPGTSYLAFRYETTVNWLDAKFDNLSVTADAILGQKDEVMNVQFSLYPNPVAEVLNIVCDENLLPGQIQIFSASGQLVKEVSQFQQSVDVGDLQNGVYMLSIHTNEGIYQKQFVVRK